MDVGKLNCTQIHPEKYRTTHPDAPGLTGEGATPKAACSDLSKTSGKTFKARLREASVKVGDEKNPENMRDGAILFEGEGSTPQQAWEACNKKKADQLRSEAAKYDAPK